MTPITIPKELADEIKLAGGTYVNLEFEGGSDEGYLCVVTDAKGMEDKIEEWVWQNYSYSGAGDGSIYGDTINYDFENNTVSTSGFFMSRVDTPDEVYSDILAFENGVETS